MLKDNDKNTHIHESTFKSDLYKHSKLPAKGEQIKEDKFGMSDEEFEEYKKQIIEDYKNNRKLSIRKIQKREELKGRKMTVHRISRWIRKAGVEIRYKNYKRPKAILSEGHSVFVDTESAEMMLSFEDRKQDVIRAAIRWVAGIPERSILVKLREGINLICLYDYVLDKYHVYLTDQLNEFEVNVISNMIQEANKHGSYVIKDFCIQNDLFYIGGEDVTEERSSN
jgi:hypothetical protein